MQSARSHREATRTRIQETEPIRKMNPYQRAAKYFELVTDGNDNKIHTQKSGEKGWSEAVVMGDAMTAIVDTLDTTAMMADRVDGETGDAYIWQL